MGLYGIDIVRNVPHIGIRDESDLRDARNTTLIYTPENPMDVDMDPAHYAGRILAREYGHNVFLTTRDDPGLATHADLIIVGYQNEPGFITELPVGAHSVLCKSTFDGLIRKIRDTA